MRFNGRIRGRFHAGRTQGRRDVSSSDITPIESCPRAGGGRCDEGRRVHRLYGEVMKYLGSAAPGNGNGNGNENRFLLRIPGRC